MCTIDTDIISVVCWDTSQFCLGNLGLFCVCCFVLFLIMLASLEGRCSLILSFNNPIADSRRDVNHEGFFSYQIQNKDSFLLLLFCFSFKKKAYIRSQNILQLIEKHKKRGWWDAVGLVKWIGIERGKTYSMSLGA